MSFEIATNSKKHFTNAFDEHNAIVVFDLLGYDRKSLSVRMKPATDFQGYLVEVTSDQGYRPAVNVIRKSKFAELIEIEKPKSFEPIIIASAKVVSSDKVTAEAEFVDGALVVLINQPVPEEEKVQHIAINCQDDATASEEKQDSIEQRYKELMKKYDLDKDRSRKESPWKESPWKYTENYWLNDKPVEKAEFEKATGKKTKDLLGHRFGDELDEMFKVFSDVFGDRK